MFTEPVPSLQTTRSRMNLGPDHGRRFQRRTGGALPPRACGQDMQECEPTIRLQRRQLGRFPANRPAAALPSGPTGPWEPSHGSPSPNSTCTPLRGQAHRWGSATHLHTPPGDTSLKWQERYPICLPQCSRKEWDLVNPGRNDQSAGLCGQVGPRAPRPMGSI